MLENTNTITDLINQTEEIVNPVESLVFQIVQTYTTEMDEVVEEINQRVISQVDCPTSVLESCFLKLSHAIYVLGLNSEVIGLRDDISKAMYKEAYNTEYLNQQTMNADKKPTQNALTALAENKAVYENLVNSVYSKAYKMIKIKLDAAIDMRGTLSKILSRHIQELSMTKMSNIDTDTRQPLFE